MPMPPLAQLRPVPHEGPLPPQQFWPAPPQGSHVAAVAMPPPPPVQPSPVPHELPPVAVVQQAWPAPPQATHMPIAQREPAAVQVPGVPQHGCARPPHAMPIASWHDPLMHMPRARLPPHMVPFAAHSPLTQQPLSAQVLAAQQACPGPPHAVPGAPPAPLPPALPPVPGVPGSPPVPGASFSAFTSAEGASVDPGAPPDPVTVPPSLPAPVSSSESPHAVIADARVSAIVKLNKNCTGREIWGKAKRVVMSAS
jgi:hypothetical protein